MAKSAGKYLFIVQVSKFKVLEKAQIIRLLFSLNNNDISQNLVNDIMSRKLQTETVLSSL